MERRDLLERLHTLSHYVNRGKDFNWRAGPLANESAGDGRLLISLDVDAAQFWGLHTELQPQRERVRKQRQVAIFLLTTLVLLSACGRGRQQGE